MEEAKEETSGVRGDRTRARGFTTRALEQRAALLTPAK